MLQPCVIIIADSLYRIPAPSIPYMGPYLNQLITIEVGMQTFVKDPPEHVNFTKLERVSVNVCVCVCVCVFLIRLLPWVRISY